jgi:acyl transferase domain-containing protein
MRSLYELANSYDIAAAHHEAAAQYLAAAISGKTIKEISARQATRADVLLGEAHALRAHAADLRRALSGLPETMQKTVLRFPEQMQGWRDMQRALFHVHEQVRAEVPEGDERVGPVVGMYEFGQQWRYIVQFNDGTEGVFFEFELSPVHLQ